MCYKRVKRAFCRHSIRKSDGFYQLGCANLPPGAGIRLIWQVAFTRKSRQDQAISHISKDRSGGGDSVDPNAPENIRAFADSSWHGKDKPYYRVGKDRPMSPSPYRFTGESTLLTVTGRCNRRLGPLFPPQPPDTALRTAL